MANNGNQTKKTPANDGGELSENERFALINPLWLGMRDSNPRSWDQNPLPYHLANPQYRVDYTKEEGICQ